MPLGRLASVEPELRWTYRGVVLSVVGILGYMLTELGHYSIFQRPRYTTKIEWVWFGATLAVMAGLLVWWGLRQ